MARLTVRSLGILLTATFFLALSTGSSFGHGPSSPGAQAPAAPPGRALAEQLTLQLAQLNTRYHLAAASHRASFESQMLAVAISREQTLAALLEDHPAEFLRVALPSSHRLSLPASVQAHTEKETDVEGTLEVLHQDDAAGGRYLHHLDTAAGRLTLKFAADEPDHLVTGARVRVHGVRLNNVLALRSGSTSVQTLSSALPNTFGAQNTLVILVNFTDKATQPYTVEAARSVVFTTTSNFDMENSYGQTWLTGDVVGWYTIPMSATVCDYQTLATYAKQAATAAGVSLSSYRKLVYGFPANACSWWGLGTVGGVPSQAWINGSFQLAVVGHEMGHNFGLYHSHNFDCGTTVLGTACTTSEYGDTLDIMGAATTGGHFNAFQKERLGWLNYGASPPLLTVTASGTYTLEPYETPSSNPKALKVLQSLDATGRKTWYYLEYRQGIGFDSFVSSNANVKSGIVVHLGTETIGNSSYLIDMTPETSSWSDPAILVGKSYADPDAGVTITPTWADATGIGVRVDFAAVACVPGTPTLTLSPSQSQWLQAGAGTAFTASVTNNDNQGCAASNFALNDVVPAGWVGTLNTPGLTLSPGATASATLTVTSSSSAAGGFYTVAVNTSDAAETTHAASASATYVVTSGLDTSVSTDKSSYGRPGSVLMTTSVRSNGAPISGASVSVKVTKANGAVTTKSATTDVNGVAVAKIPLKRSDPPGTYQALSKTSVNGVVAGQASTTFSVQ